ncbi:hypothetical protein BDZ90DRAFT_230974 [Jaminaea rosea]|uniref:Uncharacterized protein n=1 Tax=Jaminaea rosea TaxID=1569628 RepID=A0A316UUJ2_9BASI|nr:hypothetical protein BDZ90DRAFT_230974 [Jaminaea rosea]PWN28976.1 hypothetical protein BDZ90DRAFT_230974 [Jaminaea rosea]
MIEGVARRTYGLATRTTQHRNDSPAVTPAEEFESWLPDEVCVACGAQAPSRQLYCSAECKESEESKQTQPPMSSSSTTTSSSAIGSPRDTNHDPLSPRSRPSMANLTSPSTSAKLDGPTDLRYHYPQSSPLLLAQRKASSAAAFDKALLAHRLRQAQGGNSSSDDQADAGMRRRGSSRSSSASSIASSSALLTDPSTPSPALGSAAVRKHRSAKARSSDLSTESSEDDDADLNASDFQLPPSVTPALNTAAVMMNRPNHEEQQQQQHRQQPASLAWERGYASPPHQMQHRTASASHHQQHGPPISSRNKVASMSFARRPSSTNLPAPVLYSPALSAKASRVSPLLQSDKARAIASGTAKPDVARTSTARRSFKKHAKMLSIAGANPADANLSRLSGDDETMTLCRGQSARLASCPQQEVRASQPAPSSSLSLGGSTSLGGGAARLVPGSGTMTSGVMNRSSSDPVPSRRPSSDAVSPATMQHEEGSQDGSSAGTKTLAASRNSQLASLRSPTPSELCGRPGCAGAFSNRPLESSSASSASPSVAPTAHRKPSLSSSFTDRSHLKIIAPSGSPRSLNSRRHRHTHSAQAGLSIHDHFSAMRSTLLMTPARTPRELPIASPRPAAAVASIAPSGMVSPSAGASHAGGRGRSKVRDSRSISRRSRSPPRAAARGRSQALAAEERERKQPRPTSPPIEAIKPRSQPIAIGRRPSGQAATLNKGSVSSSAATSSSASAAHDADVSTEDVSQGRGRGRSPTIERQKRNSGTKAPLNDLSHLQPAFKRSANDESGDPGFDDIELELGA